METLNKNRNTIVLGTVLLFLALLLVFVAGVRPVTGTIRERGEELDRIQGQNHVIQAKIDELKNSKQEEELNSTELQALLPGSDDSEQLLLDLSRIDKETQVELVNAAFANADGNRLHLLTGSTEPIFSAVKETSVNAVVSGTYDEIRQWLIELQEFERLLTVDSFSFQQPYEFKEPGSLLTANVTFTAYYLPE